MTDNIYNIKNEEIVFTNFWKTFRNMTKIIDKIITTYYNVNTK